ncbi:unnamed protein product [Soboliphyme baturini]|uniref:E3 ubiquitin-protein ligase n=1 Tax=Soboliphyme baturini TaxID=241478 RepID=A0A183IH79_9BILA|nr:unnamed protein product [Soboliphyme baturini]
MPLYQLLDLDEHAERQLFSASPSATHAADSPPPPPHALRHLSDDMRDCLLAAARSVNCTNCFSRLLQRVHHVAAIYRTFYETVLVKLNCEPSSFDRFSAVTTCADCQVSALLCRSRQCDFIYHRRVALNGLMH